MSSARCYQDAVTAGWILVGLMVMKDVDEHLRCSTFGKFNQSKLKEKTALFVLPMFARWRKTPLPFHPSCPLRNFDTRRPCQGVRSRDLRSTNSSRTRPAEKERSNAMHVRQFNLSPPEAKNFPLRNSMLIPRVIYEDSTWHQSFGVLSSVTIQVISNRA